MQAESLQRTKVPYPNRDSDGVDLPQQPCVELSLIAGFAILSIPASARLECTIQKHSLVFNPPRYVALSYCWGDENDRKDIIVNGQVVSITTNLEEALRNLYTRIGDGIVWADALCINQSDTQERNLQVGIMKQIFEKADTVYASLGGDGFTDAIGGLHSARALSQTSPPAVVPPTTSILLNASIGLSSIFKCPFWQRRWIIQELTAASRVEIMCGTAQLSWDDLEQTYSKCSSSEYWQEEHDLAATSYRKISQLRREYWQGTIPNLCEAITETRGYLSKDPRDNIYALLGITSDGPALVPTPNYFQPVGQVSEELTRAVLNRNADLDIILADSRVRVASDSLSTGSLPTWSPDWCSPNITATAGRVANAEWRHPRGFVANRVPNMNGVLRVKGVTIGTITALTLPFDGQALRSSAADAVLMPAPNQSCKRYYHSRSGIAVALVTSLLQSDTSMLIWPDSKWLQWEKLGDAIRHILLWLCASILQRLPCMVAEETLPRYKIWLQANTSFLLDKMSIQRSLRPLYTSRVVLTLITALLLLNIACIFGVVSKQVLGQSWAMTTYTVVSGVVFVMVGVSNFIVLRSVFYGLDALSRLRGRMKSSQRLFVLDQGALGFSCNDSRQGDRICLLAGCTKAVVLRSQTVDGIACYMVVGEAEVCLNKKDEEKFRVLLSLQTRRKRGSDYFPALRTPEETNVSYNQHTWWESFDLI